ncbi:hypothetical protein BV902_13000 [Sphingobacterium sp. B29]|nr:hypothetical protein BV902_13000 [Sphingobacterium sp. B29]
MGVQDAQDVDIKMNILFIGKIPPIEGGESVSGFNHILALASKGYKIHVVTNADEVEFNFRQSFTSEDYDYFCTLLGSNIILHNTHSIKKHFHIPYSHSYFSKLFGLGSKVIVDNPIDLIIGWYFEPYGLLASILSKIHNIKSTIYHAGSDLSRLSTHPDLFLAYEWMVNNGNTIMSKPSSRESLISSFNFNNDKIQIDKGNKLPNYFKKPPKFDLKEYLELSNTHYSKQLNKFPDLLSAIIKMNSKSLDIENFTIGIYGKISSNKGTSELIKALSRLSEICKFNFISVSGGREFNLLSYYESILSHRKLSENSYILPFIPHWRIPGFIKKCDVVVFLENDFPIKIHRPQIPLEVLSQGTCLFLSKDILENLSYKKLMIDQKNFICIDKVTQDNLFDKLKDAIEDKKKISIIGGHGKSIITFLNG